MPSTPLLFAAGSAGVAAHLGIFIHGEWHLVVHHIVFAHALLFCLIWAAVYHYDIDPFNHFSTSVILFCTYVHSLWASIIVYRLFFHKLRHFPGPKLAAATKLWHVWQSRNSENHLVMRRMFEEYGTVVRTGPNEVSIFHPAGVELLDGVKNNHTKDVWYDILHPMSSLAFNRNVEEIRLRRVPWNKSMTTKCLKEYSSRIAGLVDDLVACVDSIHSTPAFVNDIMAWFVFDAMGLVTFGEDFGMVKAREQRKELSDQRGALGMLAPVNDTVWLARMGFVFFPFLKPVRSWFSAVEFCCGSMEKRMKAESDRLDISSYFLEEYQGLKTTLGLQKARDVLNGNSINAVVAGSDTTRAGLIVMIYYLCRYPEKTRKLYEEVKDIDESDHTAIMSLPYLGGFVKETLRLAPPSPTVGARLTGPNGLWVDDIWIPSGVKVNATKYVIQRLSAAFEDPDEFIPERWNSRPELVHDARAYAPFSVGPRQCVGKSVATLEMRLVATTLLKRFEITFSKEHDPDATWKHMKDQVTFQPGELWCVFTPRA